MASGVRPSGVRQLGNHMSDKSVLRQVATADRHTRNMYTHMPRVIVRPATRLSALLPLSNQT